MVFAASRSANQRNANEAYNHHREDEKERKRKKAFWVFHLFECKVRYRRRKKGERRKRARNRMKMSTEEDGPHSKASPCLLACPLSKRKIEEHLYQQTTDHSEVDIIFYGRHGFAGDCDRLAHSSSSVESVLVLLLAH